MIQLNKLQTKILEALKALSEKSTFNEAVLAKKIREINSIDSKKKAGIALADLEKAVQASSEIDLNFTIRLNSANDLLIIKSENMDLLNLECRQRRNKSEKSMTILTQSDLEKAEGSGKTKEGKPSKHDKSSRPQKRSVRTKIDINSNFEDFE